jgi:ankyrin repeat protein
VSTLDRQSWIPLHQASRHRHLDVARLLIDSGADVNHEKRWTSLHQASRHGYLDIARLLIDSKCRYDALDHNMVDFPLPEEADILKAKEKKAHTWTEDK